MNTKTKRVFAGWLNLTDDEKKEFINKITNFEKSYEFQKRDILEYMEKSVGIVLGPAPGKCPCCGR